MKYENTMITSQGAMLISQAIANQQSPVIDKMLVSQQSPSADRTFDTYTTDDFSNALSFDVNNVSQQDNNFTISAVLSNQGLQADFTAKLIGITGYVKGSDNRQLLAVSYGSDPFVLTKDDGTPVKFIPSLTVGFSNSKQVNLIVKDDVYLTMQDLNRVLDARFASIDLTSAIKQANAYTDNAKRQLDADIESGISNVNYKINNLSKSSLNYQGQLDSNNDFNSIYDTGYYRIGSSTPKNSPDNNLTWDFLIVTRENDMCLQRIYQQGKGGYSRIVNPTGYWVSAWVKYSTQEDLDNLSSKIDNLGNNTLKFVREINSQDNLDNIFDKGYYEWKHDIPLGLPDKGKKLADGILLVDNAGYNILQKLYITYEDNSNSIYNKIYYRSQANGAWSSWVKLSTNEDLTKQFNQLDANAKSHASNAEQNAKAYTDQKTSNIPSYAWVSSESEAQQKAASLPNGTIIIQQ